MKRYNLFLPQETIDALKLLAKRKGTTSSEIIRYAIDKHLAAQPAPPKPDGQHALNASDLG